MEQYFPSFPNVSLDYGALEKSDNVYVMKCDFGWADLGTWHGIYEATRRSTAITCVSILRLISMIRITTS